MNRQAALALQNLKSPRAAAGLAAFVATQPGGNAGGVTPSKFSAKCTRTTQGTHVRRPRAGTAAKISTRPHPVDVVWWSRVAALGRRDKMTPRYSTLYGSRQCGDGIWPAPKQCHRAGNMRSRHRRAAKSHISIIGGVIAGASACAWRSDIGLYPVASIDRDRAAAAKVSNVIGAGDQGSDCVRCVINRRRIHTVEQSGPSLPLPPPS